MRSGVLLMKKYAADNLLFLREQYPKIYELVRNAEYDRNAYVGEMAKNGQPNLIIQDGEAKSHMYSRYNPGLEAARWAESVADDVADADHVLLFGFGFGYHAQALMDAYPEKKLYIYEPEKDILLAAVEYADLRPVLQNRQVAIFAVGAESAVQRQLLVQILKSIKGKMAFVAMPAYRKKYGTLISEFAETMQKTAVGYQVDINTITYFRKQWAQNVIRNMERNLKSKSFQQLKDSCAGIPAVIVGSGPSLGLEIEKLRIMKDRAVIITAGSSIQALLRHGLEPHLIVSMDAGWANRNVFVNIDVSQIPFLYIPMIHHMAIKSEDSPYLMHAFFDIDHLTHYLMKLTETDPIFASSATVTGTAIQAAVHLGCKEIIFIGQDFSYPNNQYYTEGVAHVRRETIERNIAEAVLTVENTAGGFNRTNRTMLNLKHDTEAMIKVLPEITFYNASPIGAVIENTTFMTLDQAIVRYQHLGREESWFKQLVLEKGMPVPIERKQFVLRRISETMREIDELGTWLEDLETLLEEASRLKADKSGQIAAWFGKFETTWKQIVDSPVYKNVYAFFLVREQTHTARNWTDMMNESDWFRKLSKLRDCIVPLVEAIRTMHPILSENFEWLNEKVKALSAV